MYKVILVGNPNTGKTTLFNTLCNASEKASNWHGVTVECKSKKTRYENKEYLITDIPGIYSLEPYSYEEKIAVEFLHSHKNDFIINICDANNFHRNLLLTLELINSGFKVLIVVNMSKETNNCNYEKLSEELGVDILTIDARKVTTKKQVLDYLNNYAIKNKMQNNKDNYKNIDKIIKNKDIFYNFYNYKTSERLDKIFLNKVAFVPIFVFIIFLVFYLSFGPVGVFITELFNIILEKTANIIYFVVNSLNISLFIRDFINIGIINSMTSLLSFLPQLLLLSLFINILEDTGLLSRISFMFDGFMKKIGLNGKSIFSLFVGFGCSTSAIITARNIENSKQRKKTVSLVPYVPCSAKLPIFLVICSTFFNQYKYLGVFAIYVFSLLLLIIVSFFKNKGDDFYDKFILELPKYRFPNIKKILKDSFCVLKEFLHKMAKVILFFSVIVWILRNLSTDFIYLNGENVEESLLYFISSKISFLFAPLGIENIILVVSLILGICAKELVLVGLSLSSVGGCGQGVVALVEGFGIETMTVFLVFILLYSPCISAITAALNEINKKFAIKMFISQFAVAYIVAFFVRLCFLNLNYLYLIIALLIVVFSLKIMLKSKQKTKFCVGDCNVCRRI